jgi:heptosyltransferase-2
MHQVEKYNKFVNESLNINNRAGSLKLHQSNKVNKPIKQNKLLGINPGASYGSAKRWYPEKFANVAIEFSCQYDIVIFGGPGEENIANDIEKFLIEKGIKNYQNLAAQTSISELINQISILDVFITSDSGPMHIAASLNIPTVAIFGPTNDKETSQWMNEKSSLVKKNLSCQPCMKRKCPLEHHNCMKLLEASDVTKAVKRIN